MFWSRGSHRDVVDLRPSVESSGKNREEPRLVDPKHTVRTADENDAEHHEALQESSGSVVSLDDQPASLANMTLDRFKISGSKISQDLGVLYETDKERFLELMDANFKAGLDDLKAISSNHIAVGEHMQVALEGLDYESSVQCSKAICFVDVTAPNSTDSILFGTALSKGWSDVDGFTELFFAEKLNDDHHRFYLAREDIDLDIQGSQADKR